MLPMKKYVIRNRHTKEVCGRFDSKDDAVSEMMDYISNHNEDLKGGSDDKNYLTPFDFYMTEELEVCDKIKTFEDARKYLGGKPNGDFTVSQKLLSCNGVKLEDVARLVQDLNPKHVKALIALNELFSIAQAWNKADGFVPDFSDSKQDKWFPWFYYDKERAGFVFASTYNAPSYASAYLGSRLCFKSANRAKQFAVQFIDLWNDFLLFR